MKYRLVGLAGAALALVMACDQGPGISGPQTAAAVKPAFDAIVSHTNEKDVPWAQEEQNPCTGDWVTMTGSTHFIFQEVFDDTGGYHMNTRSNSRGTGLGFPSGYTYKVSEQFDYHENNPEGPQFEIHQVEHLLILGPRSVDNYIRHMVFKLTTNANGIPTADFEKSYTKCVG